MLRILPFFEVRSINIRRHLSKRQPACIFFPFRFVPPYGGGMEIKMKKKIIAMSAAVMLMGTTNAFADFDYQSLVTKDPMNNDIFEVVAEVQSDKDFYSFSQVNLEFDEATRKAKIMRYTIGYDGVVTVEELSDYLDENEAQDKYDEFDTYWEDRERALTVFNDGLVENDVNSSYDYRDINGNNYAFYDNMNPGWSSGYNLGLMHEIQYDFSYIGAEGGPTYDVGDEADTYIYTVFSDDVNCCMERADVRPFDDNGYALMTYKGKQYIVKLKRGFIPTVFYDDEKIEFDQIPVIENGRTLVPLRAIFEKIGAEVDWNEADKTVTAQKDDTQISLTIDNTTAVKNGEKIELDVPAKIVNGRTLVPVRFVADCFGVDVDWDGVMQEVILTSK